MAEAVPLPEDELGLHLLVGQDAVLEPGHETATRHDASDELELRQGPLTDREHHLVVRACRSLGHLHALGQISGQTLAPAINMVSAHEDLTVTPPGDRSIFDCLVLRRVAWQEGHVIVVQRLLVKNIEFWCEEKHTVWRRNGQVFLVGGPGCSQNTVSDLSDLV